MTTPPVETPTPAESNTEIQQPLQPLINSVMEQTETLTTEQIQSLQPAEIAALLQSLPPEHRANTWSQVPDSLQGETLVNLSETSLQALLAEIPISKLLDVLDGMETADLAFLVDHLPASAAEQLLESLDDNHRSLVEQALEYPEASIMRLLDTDVVAVRRGHTVADVLEHIRRRKGLPRGTDLLIVVDGKRNYLGVVHIEEMLGVAVSTPIRSLLKTDIPALPDSAAQDEVARIFEQFDLVSAPVVDANGRLLGRITVDDVMDVIHREAEKASLQMAGVDGEDDLFSPILQSARKRSVWLGINLLTAFIAAAVIGAFTDALEKIVVLAVLMPVVASMGGIAGSQTLTLTIRGLAMGQIGFANAAWLARKEIAVGALNGVIWAILVGACVWLWFGQIGVSFTLGIAMLLNLLAAAAAGIAIPLALQRLGQDPALSGAVILTTVTDVVGFTSFLGLSTLLLL